MFQIIIPHLDFFVIKKVQEIRVQEPYIDQVSLAQKIGVSEGYIGRIENPRLQGKYNLRMLTRVAKALRLKSYCDFFPEKTLEYDMVRIKFVLSESYSKKNNLDEDGRVRSKFKEVSITPLSEEEIMLWKKEGSPYLLNPKTIKNIFG